MLRHCVQETHHAQQMRVSAYARARTVARARVRTDIHLSIARSFSLRGYALLMNVGLRVRYACTRMLFFSTGRCARCVHVYLSIYRIYLYMFLSVLRVRCAATVSIYCARTLFFSAGQTMRRALCSYLARTTTSISIYSTRTLFFSTRVRVTMCVPHALCLLLHRTACDIERDFSRRVLRRIARCVSA